MINFVRNKPSLRPRFGTTIMMNLLVACVFYQAANWEDVDGSSVPDVIQKVNTQFGVLVQIVIGAMMGFAQPVIFGFPMERSVMLRECVCHRWVVTCCQRCGHPSHVVLLLIVRDVAASDMPPAPTVSSLTCSARRS